jgi:hypothetical protein
MCALYTFFINRIDLDLLLLAAKIVFFADFSNNHDKKIAELY